MEREFNQRLQDLKDTGKELFSISKLDTINNCLYAAYRTYKLGDRGDGNIYSIMGSKIHDVLEQIINGNATTDDLLPAMQSELDEADLCGYSFPSDAVRENWVNNMTNFTKTFNTPKGKFTTEQFYAYETPSGNIVYGYIDLIKSNADSSITIYDWKTSSKYSKADLINHGRQLVVYALGREQEGDVVSGCGWIMLKYVSVQREGSKKPKVVERRKLVKEIANQLNVDLIASGIDEIEADLLLTEAIENNDLTILPVEVVSKYRIVPWVNGYELTEDIKQETIRYIDDTVRRWKSLKSEEEYIPRQFETKDGKQDTFFCVNLCNHRKTCPFIKEYLEKQNQTTEEDDIFG